MRPSLAQRFVVLGLTFSLAATPRFALATPAEDLVGKGIGLRKEGHDDEALALFRKAYALEPSPRTRAQIGLAELALGKFIEAETDLRAAIALTSDPWIAKNEASLQTALHNVEDYLGWLVVDTAPGVEVRVGGRLVEPFVPGQKIRVVAGTVHVEIARKGEPPARGEVDVAPRKEGTITLAPLPPAKPAAPPPAAPAPPVVLEPPPLRYVGAGLVGLGVGALGIGVYFGVRAFDQKSQRDGHCEADGCDPEGLVADRRMHDAAVWSTVGLVTGVVSTTVGAVLLFRSGAAVGVQPTTTGGARLVVVGAF